MRARHLSTDWLRHAFAACAVLVLTLAGLGARAADEFLDPEIAFRLDARAIDARTVEIHFGVAPGYYLYREQFRFAADGATLGAPRLPPAKTKFDETFQKNVDVYHEDVRVTLPVEQADGAFRLQVTNQGCADKGLCYPPQQRIVNVSLAGFGGDGTATVAAPADGLGIRGASTPPGASPAASPPTYAADDAAIDRALRGGRFWTIVGVFFVAGLLLSLTPCVLPMLPILSSIIVGAGAAVSRRRGLALAASYSFGMALVYTGFGVAAGLAGEGLAASLQQPWVLALFSGGLVALALSMFGVYELRLPAAMTSRLAHASGRLPAGRVASVFTMGGVSALIVSPCVAAPLAGALVYLSQTRDVWLGGSALFALAAGMSVPLLALGVSAGALLPRAGAWMDEVKRFFGVVLLAVALWTVQSVLPAGIVLAAWGALAIGAAVLLAFPAAAGSHGPALTRSSARRIAAVLFVAVGGLQLVGAASGGADPLQPLAHLRARAGGDGPGDMPQFRTVRSVAELDAALRSAGRPAMLDFYADWCVSCKEMDRLTFTDAAVQRKLGGALLLRADVTANNLDDRALLKRFGLFGPPGTIFFDRQGREVAAARIAGFQNSERFLQTLATAGL